MATKKLQWCDDEEATSTSTNNNKRFIDCNKEDAEVISLDDCSVFDNDAAIDKEEDYDLICKWMATKDALTAVDEEEERTTMAL